MSRLERNIVGLDPIPPSGLGPGGKLKIETEDQRRHRLETTRQLLREIAEIPDATNAPPDEAWMRGIDEMRPHRPLFRGEF